ncbi:hypothetical protein PHMEG_00027135, partial [Phytophthora megakarya]
MNAEIALEERERMLNSQWSNFEQQLKKREEEWKLEREAMANGMQESLSPPSPASLNPVRAVAAKNSQTPIVGASPTVASVQHSVAVDQKREIKRETPTPPSAVKRTESQVARKTTVRKEESASSSSKRSQPKKAKKQSDPPPDDPNDSEPSDSDNGVKLRL